MARTKEKTAKQLRVEKQMKAERKRKAAINKRKAKERLKEINRIADKIQKESGKKTKQLTVYKKGRRAALKEAGKVWKRENR